MRILFTQKMAGIAGAETYYLRFLPVLREHGIDATFLVLENEADVGRNDPFVRELEAGGVTVERIRVRGLASLSLLRGLADFVRVGRFDLVQSNLIHADVWLAAVKRLFLPRMKLVSTKHGYSDVYQSKHGFDPTRIGWSRMAVLTRLAATQADRGVAISHGLGKLLTEGRLVPPSKLAVIPYGFSFAGAISELPAGAARSGTPQLVTVGRLVAVKQHDLLIRTLPALVDRFPELKLVIVGSGPEEARLKALATELGVAEHIVWTGFVRNIHDYLRDSDVFAFASKAEGFGAVTLEAWFNELPVVAFDVPAQNEIITDGGDGYLVPPFDMEQLTARLLALLEDEELRKRMGSRGRATYEESYTLDVMTKSSLDLYRSVLTNA